MSCSASAMFSTMQPLPGIVAARTRAAMAAIGLPKQGHTVGHFSALPYADLPGFIVKLRAAHSAETIRLALEFSDLDRSTVRRSAGRDQG